MFRQKIHTILFFPAVIILFFLMPLHGAPEQDEVRYESTEIFNLLLGVKGGYSQVIGHFDDELNDSFSAGIYTFPLVFTYFMAEFDFSFSFFPLSNNDRAGLYSASISGGPLAYYSFYPFLQIYGGIAAQGNYLYLKADKNDVDERTFKPGFVMKAGLFFSVKAGFRARLGMEYTINPLSGESFENIRFIAGVSYNFSYSAPSGKPVIIQVVREDPKIKKTDELYEQGIRELKQKKYLEARKYFNEVLSIIPEHEDAVKQLAVIERAVDRYRLALRYLARGRKYSAIPPLEFSAAYIKEAEKKLAEVRKSLYKNIAPLKKAGLDAYEKQDFKKCIDIARTILLIDPDNAFARLYLERASKRYRAFQKLK